MPFPCHAVPLIHTCHAALLPSSESVVSLVKFRVVVKKYPNFWFISLTDLLFCSVLLPHFTVVDMDRCEEHWYSYDDNLRGTPRGSRKKPKSRR